MKMHEWDPEARTWRVNWISTIENTWLRRTALLTTAPLFFGYWLVGTLLMAVAVMITAPFFMLHRSWPRELFRSVALRWDTPKPKEGSEALVMQCLADWVFDRMMARVALRRPPDFIVGTDNPDGAYLERWFLTPWRKWQSRVRKHAELCPTRKNRLIARLAGLLPNLYLHRFLRDDDDRAHHDHPSWAVSFIARRGYIEHTIAAGGIHHRRAYGPGSLRFMPTRHTHRIELHRDEAGQPQACWSIFMFGPACREWGFHCPQRGWVHWKEFTAEDKPGEVGEGCGA